MSELKNITESSSLKDINDNFENLKTKIDSKILALHYLDMYSLKGRVQNNLSNIINAYNLLNLNEGLLIFDAGGGTSVTFSKVKLYVGDYLIKTTNGPLRIPGPETGLYVPTVDGTGQLSFTYEPTYSGQSPASQNIKGESGEAGYQYHEDVDFPISDKVISLTPKEGIVPLVFFYHEGVRIDIPYSIVPYNSNTQFLLNSSIT